MLFGEDYQHWQEAGLEAALTKPRCLKFSNIILKNMAEWFWLIIAVANLWMAIILLGIGRKNSIDKWLKSDTTAIENLKERVTNYTKSVSRKPNLTDYMVMLGIAFTAVGIAHWGADGISSYLTTNFDVFNDKTSSLSSFTSKFFWMITIATTIGVALSFTKAKKYEGAGASTLGSVFIYFLVATIGMKMDFSSMVFENPGLILNRFNLDGYTRWFIDLGR